MGITIFKIFIWYIVRYTFGNHVLRLRLRAAVKLNFRPYIRRYTSTNENFEYSYSLNIFSISTRGPYMRGSRSFSQGGRVHAQLPEISSDNVFLVLNLFYSLNYNFQRFLRGSNVFQGPGQSFSRGGGPTFFRGGLNASLYRNP